nr:hypothetical protein Iba_chr04bCG13460 [Ipomoea batatas]
MQDSSVITGTDPTARVETSSTKWKGDGGNEDSDVCSELKMKRSCFRIVDITGTGGILWEHIPVYYYRPLCHLLGHQTLGSTRESPITRSSQAMTKSMFPADSILSCDLGVSLVSVCRMAFWRSGWRKVITETISSSTLACELSSVGGHRYLELSAAYESLLAVNPRDHKFLLRRHC